MKPLVTSRTDWSDDLIKEVYKHIEEVAFEDLKLDIYPNQIEIISAEQMIDAYASIGLPVNYSHWSFGKTFLNNWHSYQKGASSLAYEIVLNSNPCIAYLMEENDMITQTLVIAHACFGHNFVNKHNYMFRDWTHASSIIDYMIFAKNYIRDCEEKYGEDEVERVLDSAHALAHHGVDHRKRKYKKKLTEEEARKKILDDDDEKQKHLDIILKKTSPQLEEKEAIEDLDKVDDEENLLYFIFKNAPNMEPWKREVLRIVYKIRQYFYPQEQVQVLNEGFATFTHTHILNALEEKGIISADAQMAWLALNSAVIFQPDLTTPKYYRAGHLNPYALGLSTYRDIVRICENPTQEDREWFPQLAGSDWRAEIKKAASDYRDDSFLEQFVSPTLMRKYKMMTVDIKSDEGLVTEISDDLGYRNMRRILASEYTRINRIPEIVVSNARMRGDRMLTLEYRPYQKRTLHKQNAEKTLKHVKHLWGYDVELVQRLGPSIVETIFRG